MILNRFLLKFIILILMSCFVFSGCGWEDEDTETESGTSSLISSITYVSASASKIVLKGSGSTSVPESSKLSFKALDDKGLAVQNAKISFSISEEGITNGITLSTTEATSDSDGIVEVTASSGSIAGIFTITASNKNISSKSDIITIIKKSELVNSIDFVSVTDPTIALKGNGNDQVPDFTYLKFKLLDSGGAPVSGATVNLYLSTDTGNITLSSQTGLSDANGEVSVIAYAGTSLTTFEVWASLETNNSIKAKSSTITITSNKVKAISFISAAPTLIALKGTGGTDLTETSAIKFKAVDESGNPVTGATLNFDLSTTNGGISLGTNTGKTNTSGEITVNLTSGTVPTSVTVTASLASDPNIRVISTQINVSTGRAEKRNFTVGPVGFHAIGAWTTDGIEKDVNVRAFDRFHHPVPDGTVVSFRTEWGGIDSFCQTIEGTCSVKWRSVGARSFFSGQDTPGRVTITASVMGEEGFVDVNADGMYDQNDQPFWDSSVGEQSEMFINNVEIKKVLASTSAGSLSDDNIYKWEWVEDNDYVLSTDEFLDDNENGVLDNGNGIYNGKLCTDIAQSEGICSKDLVRVWSENVILATPPEPAASCIVNLYDAVTGNPVYMVDLDGLPVNSVKSLVVEITDYLGNPLPGATSVSFSALDAAGEEVDFAVSLTKTTIPETAWMGIGSTLFNVSVFRTSVQKSKFVIKISGNGEKEIAIPITEPLT